MQKYKIIYADCPWSYDNPKGNNPAMGGITYPTMSVEDLKNLPVNSIADRDCALFFWATFPKLREAFEVIDAWGFKYITDGFNWVKLNPKAGTFYSGLGHWTNGNAEVCLFAKRGHPKRIAKNVKQLVISPVGKHSAKPAEVRDRIVRLIGDLPRIELFARQKTKGWDALGNEIDGKDIRDALAEIISEQNTIEGLKEMLHKNNIQPNSKLLPAYCHYPVEWAKNEYQSSIKHRYQITTIDWNYVTNPATGQIDPNYVHKNIYEMPLDEFKNWYTGLQNEEIISIEKYQNKKYM